MSWTKRISHPNELVHIDDEIEVVVLGINKEKQEISLGMKQTQDQSLGQGGRPLSARHDGHRHRPQPDQLRGLHRDRRGDRRPAARQRHVVDPQDQPSQRSGRKGPDRSSARCCRSISSGGASPWGSSSSKKIPGPPTFPGKYQPGQVVTGTVTKLTNFGVFVGLENGLEGLLHISELADHKVENPEEIVKVGDKIEVKVLRGRHRASARSACRASASNGPKKPRKTASGDGQLRRLPPARPPSELKGGVGGESGPLITPAG